MSDDNVMITAWEYSPISTDSGDMLWTGNDIFAAPSSGAGTANKYHYNTPKANIDAITGTVGTNPFPTSCFWGWTA
jgi:hypothetical protein